MVTLERTMAAAVRQGRRFHGARALGVHLRVLSKMGVWEPFGYGFSIRNSTPQSPHKAFPLQD